MPRMMVTTKPPGPEPGIIHLASNPAIAPTSIHEMIPTSPSFARGLVRALASSLPDHYVSDL
jgi:hypothetical protein